MMTEDMKSGCHTQFVLSIESVRESIDKLQSARIREHRTEACMREA